MNSTNIWKKRKNDQNDKKSNRIVNQHHFKSKKKKSLINFLNPNLVTNWINNKQNDSDDDDDDESQSLKDLNFTYKNSLVEIQNQDQDSLQIENLQRLSTMKNIIFLDLDNFSRFFQHLTNPLPDKTYVIAFQASNLQWRPPKKLFDFYLASYNINKKNSLWLYFSDLVYEKLLDLNNFHLMHPSGNRHDAADFALVLTVKFYEIYVYSMVFFFFND